MQESPNAGSSDEALLSLLSTYLKTKVEKGSQEQEDHAEAFDLVQWMIENDADLAWRVVRLACSADITDEDMAFVAAGVLENLLGYHGPAIFERLETAARQDKRMRLMLAMVWQGFMGAEIWDEVQALRRGLSIQPL